MWVVAVTGRQPRAQILCPCSADLDGERCTLREGTREAGARLASGVRHVWLVCTELPHIHNFGKCNPQSTGTNIGLSRSFMLLDALQIILAGLSLRLDAYRRVQNTAHNTVFFDSFEPCTNIALTTPLSKFFHPTRSVQERRPGSAHCPLISSSPRIIAHNQIDVHPTLANKLSATMADAEPTLVAQILERIAYEFALARPMLPTYFHLIASALFPIYTGAHASLSRPSTAAKPSKKKRREALHRNSSGTEDDDESSDDEEEEEQHNMEGLSPKDAILMPLFAGLALSGLYFLLKWMNDPTLLNKILNAYFAIFGVFSVSKLVTDVLDIGHSIIFPRRHVINGTLYHVNGREKKAVPVAGNTQGRKALSTPLPGFLASTPLNNRLRKMVWDDRAMPSNKWSLKLYLHRALAAKFKIGAHGIVGALAGLCVVSYFNFVDKPWYLTNLLGFGFSYGALQLMSPTTFATGSLILGALFFYDIYFVFYT